ncbi:hypothetical protein RhiXN_04332 [Rhizoctonia solani]|uniref:DUF6589 domain-containing protein n=1 Tax=Rhizoctonia solani TaxID=456999 RepID=A0A8H8SS15_9AGAM|nr:uncharacterized protein RhiXN_04332 [Rhizoctonia solani]QRW16331.1 hypothetical protein RhiXN_04332 [Rhizoctonia solani]
MSLNQHSLDWGDLLVFAFDPAHNPGRFRAEQFWHCPENFSKLMRLWTSDGATCSGQQLVKDFAIDLVSRLMKRESRRATKEGFLRLAPGDLPIQTNEFGLQNITKQLNLHCATTMSVLKAVCTLSKQKKTLTEMGKSRKEKVVSVAALSLLQEYNQLNNKFQSLSSLFLYASGVSRQGISVISSYGNSTSYSKLIARPNFAANVENTPGCVTAVKQRKAGTLFNLSQACRQMLREIAAERPMAVVYNNINIYFRSEQVAIGKKDTLESGTCATAFELFKASPEDMKVLDLNAKFINARGLTLDDIQLTHKESSLHLKCIEYTILDIIVTYGGHEFQRYRLLLDEILPLSEIKREVHHDRIYPMPTMELDEATIKGNIEICQTLFKELGLDTSTLEFAQFVRILAGDQLTVSRLRTIAKNRIGHESSYESFEWLVPIIGLFHLKMAQTQGILETHLGHSNSSRNPTSLAFQNTILHQKPIPTPTPFHTARDLIQVSLYARILHCFQLVSGNTSLSALANQLSLLDSQDSEDPPTCSFRQLRRYAQDLYQEHASTQKVYHLRQARKAGGEGSDAGDAIFEDSSLFIRDALELQAYTAAIKAGDSGRALISLKLWALAFRANGRSKYAQEMLYLIHNLTHVWPQPLRDIILNNWLLNPTGNPNSHVELDLVQEHLIFWIKNMYKAHGSGASWEWLAHISPCVDFLRRLAREFQRTLGDDQGAKHAQADLSRSIDTLIRSFTTNEIHTIKPGRSRADADGPPIVDMITEGMRQLVHGTDGPIAKFNRELERLQKRRKLMPVSTQWEHFQSTMETSDTHEHENMNGTEGKSEDEWESMHVSKAQSDSSELGVEDQGEHSDSKTEAEESESEEGEDEEFRQEAFSLEFELGNEVFNAFGDPSESEEEEPAACGELDSDNDSLIDEL